MRKTLVAVFTFALLAGPLASVASAHHDPVREAFCRLADKLGYEWVQDCNMH